MHDFEKLGAFYLGKRFDLNEGAVREELLLYDSKDLTTHAVCVGMTGSGKTGLCLSLLEEAAIDGIPAIAIDPKGDLGNLLLSFPDLAADDFRPWIDESAAVRKGQTPEQFAEQTAETWRDGLASWGQDAERIGRFRNAVDLSIYTPGSNAGLPLTVLRSFAAPTAAVLEDPDAFRERVSSATSGLLALLGIDADPVRSREHILVSNLLTHAWQDGRDLDIAALIGEIQTPPFDKVGIVDVETFFPSRDRVALAMNLNNLLASPSFASWMEGEPLNIKNLLYTSAGKPRLSILSIAHLSETERMFFVTILLNEVLAWIRSQPGTSSLRAILYMDEVFGYFPPVANPPSKPPMLTLLKQARAYGLGVVLATQNPADLDYKGLSNTGTWFLGRLQAERDKARVLEGLEGASAQAGAGFDRQKMEATLAGLGSRVFLMNNVHEDEPFVFHTRWALSYLRGPITRQQIQKLMAEKKAEYAAEAEPPATAPAKERIASSTAATEPQPASLPADIAVHYLRAVREVAKGGRLVYRPALLASTRLHFVRAGYKVDAWQPRCLLLRTGDQLPDDFWAEATPVVTKQLALCDEPETGAVFAALPAAMGRARNYSSWNKRLAEHLYRTETLAVWKCTELKKYSEAGETEGDFRIRMGQLAHELRDLQVEKLRKKYSSKLATLKNRIERAVAAVEREKGQASRAIVDSAISFGSSILGALFGRKLGSRTNVTRASTSMRSAGRAHQQRGDVARAEDKVDSLQEQFHELEAELEEEIKTVEEIFRAESLELEPLSVRPRKSDIECQPLAVVWTPWSVDNDGIAAPLFELPAHAADPSSHG